MLNYKESLFSLGLVKVFKKELFNTNHKILKDILTESLFSFRLDRRALDVHKMIDLKVQLEDKLMIEEFSLSAVNG